MSRLLTALGHEVIVAHAQKVRLIVKSRRKDAEDEPQQFVFDLPRPKRD